MGCGTLNTLDGFVNEVGDRGLQSASIIGPKSSSN